MPCSAAVIGVELKGDAVMFIHQGLAKISRRSVMRVHVFVVDGREGEEYPVRFVVPGQPDAEVEIGGIRQDFVPPRPAIQNRHGRLPYVVPFVDESVMDVDLFKHFIRQLVEREQTISGMRCGSGA